jgi:hypothetical protein
MQVKGGQGEAESYTKGGAKKAKGGGEMSGYKIVLWPLDKPWNPRRWRNMLKAWRKGWKK